MNINAYETEVKMYSVQWRIYWWIMVTEVKIALVLAQFLPYIQRRRLSEDEWKSVQATVCSPPFGIGGFPESKKYIMNAQILNLKPRQSRQVNEETLYFYFDEEKRKV